MTTIAYRDGALAFDSQVSDGNRFDGTMMKGIKGDYFVAAMSGAANRMGVLGSIYVDKSDNPVYDKSALTENEELVVVTRAGVFFCNNAGPLKFDAPFYVAGSGGSIAMGAMAHGASAEEAVQIACKYDTKTSAPVHVLRIDD